MEDVLLSTSSRILPKVPDRPISADTGMATHPAGGPRAAEDATPLPVPEAPAPHPSEPALDLSDDGGRWESADRTVFGWLIGATALLAAGVAATFTALGR